MKEKENLGGFPMAVRINQSLGSCSLSFHDVTPADRFCFISCSPSLIPSTIAILNHRLPKHILPFSQMFHLENSYSSFEATLQCHFLCEALLDALRVW